MDIARDFDSFGGSVAQFNNVGILLNRSIVDSPAFAIAYDRHLHNKLPNYARERTPPTDYLALLPDELFDIKRYVSNSPQPKGESEKAMKREGLVLWPTGQGRRYFILLFRSGCC